MSSLWEGHILVQSHQPDKGNFTGCRSPADPARNMPKLADLLNHAEDVGGTYTLGHVGTGDVLGRHEKACAHLEHSLTCGYWDVSPCLLSAWKVKATGKR